MDQIIPKFLFFTGKGGVGKTTLACATAVQLADSGLKILLVSTDPASNLSDVLQTEVNDQITPHKLLLNLYTININPEIAADEYRKRVIDPLKDSMSNKEITKIKEDLSGACTTEIASFDEFSRFISGEGYFEKFDKIVFDTAPTGHTIRLLELPAAWDTFIVNNPNGASCLGPSSALKNSKERYKLVVDSLKNPKLSRFYLVARPDTASLKEALKTSNELKELGMICQNLLINGVYEAIDKSDSIALKLESDAQSHVNNLEIGLNNLEINKYPLLPYNILGLDKIRSIFDKSLQIRLSNEIISQSLDIQNNLNDITELVNELEFGKENGLIMTMGKGGVGKTLIATTIAVLLANRGHKVLLTTTDPAAHITDFINQLEAVPPNLTIERIDPKVETQIYINKVIELKEKQLNDEEKRLLVEDLKSPCTEEVAVFHAFSRAIHKAKRQFVVVDTAPTGHTLLLLDTTGSYHKEILKTTKLNLDKITTPYMSLQDSNFAKILLVTLPETTPMREAESLQKDLNRAGIKPHAWIINQCFSSLTGLSDPILRQKANSELEIINIIRTKITNKVYGIPYMITKKLLPELLNKLKS